MALIRGPGDEVRPRGRPKKGTKSSEILQKRRTLKFSDLKSKVEANVPIEAKSTTDEVKDEIVENKIEESKDKKDVKHWYPSNRLSKSREKYDYSDLISKEKSINKAESIPVKEKKEKIKEINTNKDLISQNQYINVKSSSPPTKLFEKGNVPRSPGRPMGSRNKITLMLETIGSDNAAAVWQKLIDLALGVTKEGDINACKIVLDRVYPVRKARQVNLEFDCRLDTIQDINDTFKHILQLVIAGEMSTEEAQEYGIVLEQKMKFITDATAMDKIETTIHRVSMMNKRM